MATRAGTNSSKAEEAVVAEEVVETEEELESRAKEDNQKAKAALTRLEKAVDSARKNGWTVSGRVARLDVYGASEGTEL